MQIADESPTAVDLLKEQIINTRIAVMVKIMIKEVNGDQKYSLNLLGFTNGNSALEAATIMRSKASKSILSDVEWKLKLLGGDIETKLNIKKPRYNGIPKASLFRVECLL